MIDPPKIPLKAKIGRFGPKMRYTFTNFLLNN